MKKRRLLLTAVLSFAMFAVGCTPGTMPSTPLNPKEFETDASFLTFADLPPSPLSPEALEIYRDLGMNICILTEDNAKFTNGGIMTEEYKQAIRNIGNAGMDVWIRNMYNDPDYFQNETVKQGSNYGTPYTMEARNITDQFDEFPEVTGYYMSDEPFMTTLPDKPLYAAMDQYEKLVEWKNTYAKDAYWHMNMVPSSSYDHFVGYTYRQFIEYYVEHIVAKLESGGRSICLDNYPLRVSAPEQISATYLSDLLTVASVTKAYNDSVSETMKANYGICLQTFAYPGADLKDIESPAEVTFQIYTGMAMGARLFEYFCYRSFGDTMYGILDSVGNKRIYDYVKEANEETLDFAKVLCGFDWQGLLLSPAVSESMRENEEAFEAVRDLVISSDSAGLLKSVSSRLDAIVGHFERNGQDGYMVVNYVAPSTDRTNTVNLDFGDCTQAVVWRAGVGERVQLVDGKLQFRLNAGEGVFVVPA